MKKLFSIALFIFSGILFVSAQSFEGVIEFKKQTVADTVHYVYYVKGGKVRLDEIGNKSKKVEGSFIIDLKTSSMVSIDPARKLYIEQSSGAPVSVTGKTEVKKTGNTKMIQSVKCSEYIVKNADEKTQITYWMASGKYDFFFKLLKVLNRKDKSSLYIQQLTDVDGMFPFLSSQVNLETHKEEVRLEVTKVEKKNIDEKKFEVPKGYTKFQK